MRVFVAGATGAIGTRLVSQLIERGHEVIGTYRSPGHADRVRALGAEPVAPDLPDAKARRELGWTPRYPSWRQGFAAAYGPDRPHRGPGMAAHEVPGTTREPG